MHHARLDDFGVQREQHQLRVQPLRLVQRGLDAPLYGLGESSPLAPLKPSAPIMQ